jgi:hypothetical protein
MLRRRANRVMPPSRYDVPLTTGGTVGAASALADTRPPDDAFVQLVGEGETPPGHIWPIAFAREPLDFWGEDNVTWCWYRMRSAGFDPNPDSRRIYLAVQAFEEGEPRSAGELLQLHFQLFDGVVATFLASCQNTVRDDGALRQRLEEWVLEGRSRDQRLGALDGVAPDAVALFIGLAHCEMRLVDFRIGYDMAAGRWNPSSPSSVYMATARLIKSATLHTRDLVMQQ